MAAVTSADVPRTSFAEARQRIDEILNLVSDESVSLEDALQLCEEAVALGLRASDQLEDDIPQDSHGEAPDALAGADASNASDAADISDAARASDDSNTSVTSAAPAQSS